MLTINVIGFGNLGYSLVAALQNLPNVCLQAVVSSKDLHFAENEKEFPVVKKVEELSSAKLTILAVPDSVIAQVSEAIPYCGELVVHTSGAQSIDMISEKHRRGVWYPLQSFSRFQKVAFTSIPICVEAEQQTDEQLLWDFAKCMSNNVYKINSEQRPYIHLIAVFINNFTNHLVALGQEISEEHQIPFELFLPLLKNTFEKLEKTKAKEAQTGPAHRYDENTIAKHLDLLKDENQKNIYNLLTKSIQKLI